MNGFGETQLVSRKTLMSNSRTPVYLPAPSISPAPNIHQAYLPAHVQASLKRECSEGKQAGLGREETCSVISAGVTICKDCQEGTLHWGGLT